MRSVILFGGGDGGGLLITESGVKPIPPFGPDVLMTLKATAALVTAVNAARNGKAQRKLSRLATSLAAASIEQVEDVVGPLSGESALVFQDDGGGFTCGSTGKPPQPVPWPPSRLPSIDEMVSQGVVGADFVAFLRAVRASKIKLNDALENPVKAAKELGIPLSDKSAGDLRLISPSQTAAIKDSTEREIISFFHRVAADGGHLDSWFSRPYEVSQDLGVNLSDAALDRLVTNGAAAAFGVTKADTTGKILIAAGVVWAVVWIVVGIAVAERPVDVIVQDTSGRTKI